MNRHFLILSTASLVIVSCENGGRFSSGGFDPLEAGGGGGRETPQLVNTGYKPGDFVKTSTNNAAFFKTKPKGDATADKLLPGNTPMKVITTVDSYLKVELDSGEVGFVPEVMVIDQNPDQGTAYGDGAIQVWPPPAGGVEPYADPNQPTIPTDIDPDAPEPTPPPPPLPDDAPTPGLGAEPAVPSVPVESPELPEAPAE